MITRADLDRLNRANNQVANLANQDLQRLFLSLNLADPISARNTLLEIAPLLVSRYAEISAVAGAEWYETIQPSSRLATVKVIDNSAEVAGSVRYAAKGLFAEDPNMTLGVLKGAVKRHVISGARTTLLNNISQDRRNPRWARVPAGVTTCAFCTVMASRGFGYSSREAATYSRAGNEYHDDCDCMIVPEWSNQKADISGYDADAMYAQYLIARETSKSTSLRDILAEMRTLYPNSFTDSHSH